MPFQIFSVNTSALPDNVLSLVDDAFYKIVEVVAGPAEAQLLDVQADLPKRVYSILGQNSNLKNNDVVKHFVQEAEDLSRSDRPTSFKGKSLKRLQNVAANRIGVSQRKLGKNFDVAQSTIHYNLNKIGLKYYKRQKAPKYNKSRFKKVPKKCRK
ncbi:unnamed protein product [Rotaria magnacalcarata]|uniref:Uncharacterized protein n=1 Tax=Rotaria magnacalcarata TaxID=392030 RepID=A0A816SM48_9BILA|nr:unnamed protein product [Rotaria magnacalcarata]